MNGKQAKELVIKHFNKDLNSLGFELKKTRDTHIHYYNRYEGGYNHLGNSFDIYTPLVRFGFVMWKRIDEVETILEKMHKCGIIDTELTTDSPTLSLRHNHVDLKLISVGTEQELIGGFKKIITYITKEALPVLNSFNDLRNIDKIVNGEGENFWEDDSGHKPFTLAHFFYVRRLIIARLCKNDIEYSKCIEKVYEQVDNRLRKVNQEPFDRLDAEHELNKIIAFITEKISHVY